MKTPLQKRAKNAVQKAVRKGLLYRPLHCSRCGKIPPKAKDGRHQIQGHHADYNKPLEVEWLCVYCHRKETPAADWSKYPGKKYTARGTENVGAKLTAQQVLMIRASAESNSTLAKKLGVDKSTITRAKNGSSYILPPPPERP